MIVIANGKTKVSVNKLPFLVLFDFRSIKWCVFYTSVRVRDILIIVTHTPQQYFVARL